MEPFAQPKIMLEQYPTGPHIASHMLYTVGSGCVDASLVEQIMLLDAGCVQTLAARSARPSTRAV